MKNKIFLTGEPHCGKSTLLFNLIKQIPNKRGFLTKAIYKKDIRTGFKIVTDDNQEILFAHTDFITQHKVSKYYVDLEYFESILPKLFAFHQGQILFIDEIGQMQLMSDSFKKLVRKYLSAENTLIATLSKVYDDQLIKEIKARPDIEIINLTVKNRDKKFNQLYQEFKQHLI